MIPRVWMQGIAWCGLLLMFVFAALEVEARGGRRGGGGRSFSRSSPARSGSVRGSRPSSGRSFSRSSPARSGSVQGRRAYGRTPQATRRAGRSGRRDVRRDVRSERREIRRDVRSEIHEHNEWHEDRWKFRVGTALTISAFRALSCATSTVVMDGVSYYRCGSTWYSRAYSGGNVTYVVVTPPAGAQTSVITVPSGSQSTTVIVNSPSQ